MESVLFNAESCMPVLLPDFLDISNVDDESVEDWAFVLFFLLLPQLIKVMTNEKIASECFMVFVLIHVNHKQLCQQTFNSF
jgi:hypothetical protein